MDTITTRLQEIYQKTEQNETNIGLILTRVEALEPQVHPNKRMMKQKARCSRHHWQQS